MGAAVPISDLRPADRQSRIVPPNDLPDTAGAGAPMPDAGLQFAPKKPGPVRVTPADAAQSFSDLKQLGRGGVSGLLGTPGDMEKFGLGLVPGGDKETRVLPTTEEVEKKIFGEAPAGERETSMRHSGEVIGGLLPGTGPLISAGRKAPTAARFAERILPGATERATGAISKIAEPIGRFDPLGQDIIKDTVGGEYARLYDTRAKLLGTAAHITDEAERTKAFRKIYQSDEFAPLRKFEQTPLGKKLTQTTGKYSEVVKADPAKIPDAVFDTPQSVRDFRNLLGGDQGKVDQYARRYAVESLNKVMDAARRQRDLNPLRSRASIISDRVDAWLADKNQEWLNETPETKKALEDFATGLRDTAKAQDRFRKGVGALGVTGLFESGMHPWSWINRLIGNLGE